MKDGENDGNGHLPKGKQTGLRRPRVSIHQYSLDISSKIVNGLSLKVRKFGPITGYMKRHGKAL